MSDGEGQMGAGPTPEVAESKRRTGRPPTHQLTRLRQSLTQLTTRRLDGRSAVAVQVRRWKEDVRRDRGGDLTRAEETILEGAAQKLIIKNTLWDHIAQHGAMVGRKRMAAAVVMQFMQVTDSLNRDLERLGLKRQQKQIDLPGYFAELHRLEEAERQQREQQQDGGGEGGSGGDDNGSSAA